jgi:FXSXX-COOH protein
MDAEPHGGTETAYGAPAPDVLGLDLESLRTVEHPVLSALVSDLRERIAAPGGEALWGFDNAM